MRKLSAAKGSAAQPREPPVMECPHAMREPAAMEATEMGGAAANAAHPDEAMKARHASKAVAPAKARRAAEPVEAAEPAEAVRASEAAETAKAAMESAKASVEASEPSVEPAKPSAVKSAPAEPAAERERRLRRAQGKAKAEREGAEEDKEPPGKQPYRLRNSKTGNFPKRAPRGQGPSQQAEAA